MPILKRTAELKLGQPIPDAERAEIASKLMGEIEANETREDVVKTLRGDDNRTNRQRKRDRERASQFLESRDE